MKDTFTSNVVSSVLGRLVQVEPLPRLLMRTILKSWEVHTDMRRCALLPPPCPGHHACECLPVIAAVIV